MRDVEKRITVRRRVLLRGAGAAPAAAALAMGGAGIGPGAAWASDLKTLRPETMTTLVKVARDTFPHDSFPDRLYVAAVVTYDEQAGRDARLGALLEEGVAALNAEARRRHGRDYLGIADEDRRVDILKAQQESAFFRKLRGDLVVSLYNQREVWAKLGYEGSSFEHGGYLERGFNDIDWLPEA